MSEILVVYLYISAQIWTLKFIFMDLVIMPAWCHLEIFFLLSRQKEWDTGLILSSTYTGFFGTLADEGVELHKTE